MRQHSKNKSNNKEPAILLTLLGKSYAVTCFYLPNIFLLIFYWDSFALEAIPTLHSSLVLSLPSDPVYN